MITPLEKKRAYNKQWKLDNPEKVRAQKRAQHERMKKEVFAAYGGKCKCCGETDLHFLTIDHIDKVIPDSHRQPDGRRLSGTAFLLKIRKEGYPDTCQILCWNCNCAMGYYGFCPHQPHTPEQRRYS